MRKPRPRVEVVAMAWEQKHPDRAGRRLEFWAAGAKGEASQQAVFLRQAIADADWAMVERHGGLDVVMEKIFQWGQETPAFNGAG